MTGAMPSMAPRAAPDDTEPVSDASRTPPRAASSVIPEVTCPRCHAGMRLSTIEPAGMSGDCNDTLVFECVCGVAVKRPAIRDQ